MSEGKNMPELPSPLEALRTVVYAYDRRVPDARPFPTLRQRDALEAARLVLTAHHLSPYYSGDSE